MQISEFDIIIDSVGGADVANAVLPLLKKDGSFCNYGWNGRRQYGRNPFNAAHSFRIYSDGYDEEQSNSQVQIMVLEGRLFAQPWYDMANPVPLSRIGQAYDSLCRHEAQKYLIELK